jgi:ADP-ribosylglycohydrolase
MTGSAAPGTQHGGDVVTTEDRARGALAGLAVGDALGMPTQMLPRATVQRLFPKLSWFEAGPAENRISAGHRAGRVTDDTEQALILAELLIEGRGHADPRQFAARLAAWARQAEADGSEQLGPSSRRAIEAVAAGSPVEEAGRTGTTNGAAMRITPVGIATGPEDLTMLVDRVEEACLVTHHTGVAIAGAAAVAAAVSAGLAGLPPGEALDVACRAAEMGAARGRYVAGPDVARRIAWAAELVQDVSQEAAADLVASLIGTGVATEQAVPAAFALAWRWQADPWQACLAAARLGGDADTIGAIAGAVGGAWAGVTAFPAPALAVIEEVNGLRLADMAQRLLTLRAESAVTSLAPRRTARP